MCSGSTLCACCQGGKHQLEIHSRCSTTRCTERLPPTVFLPSRLQTYTRAQLIFPEYRTTGRGSIGHISIDQGNTSAPASPSHRRSSHRRSDASRNSFLQMASMMQFVQAGDSSNLEKFLSGMSPSERELAFAAETAVGGNRSPILMAVKCGNLAVVRTILKWLPEGQVKYCLSLVA